MVSIYRQKDKYGQYLSTNRQVWSASTDEKTSVASTCRRKDKCGQYLPTKRQVWSVPVDEKTSVASIYGREDTCGQYPPTRRQVWPVYYTEALSSAIAYIFPVAGYVFDINQLSLPTPLYSVLVPVFVFHGSFNCISFHKFSRQLPAFSLCSFGFTSVLLVHSTIYLFLKVSLSPDIILWA